ncbi:fasciclin-1-like [Uloborus diversus]|uniref:fasciclin-1-like n=1 Tax=Uloborus diversus TaxID=327109 RepID=UPI00240A6035|nr:fasciclin-1-like [Uloborus diversus]
MVNRDEVLQVLLDRRDVTLFAPTNTALRKSQAKKTDSDPKKDDISRFYVLHLLAEKKLFPISIAPYLPLVAPLYLSLKQEDGERTEYFVNNAKIIRQATHRGTEGKNQLLYVIDQLLEAYKPISTQPPTAFQLLKQPSIYGLKEPLDAFASRVSSETEKEFFNRVGNHTFFLPVGSADSETSPKLQDIDTWVVRGHVISQNVLFLRAMSKKTYKSETWGANLKVELKIVNEGLTEDDDKWYIQSNTIQSDARHRKGVVRAKIVRPNIPVSNGVVHLISKPLMVIDKTIWDFIEEERPERLGQFYNLVNSSPRFLSHLKSSDQKTVFAPTDKAFRALDSDKLQHVLSNTTATNNLLELHMVMRSVATEDVWTKNVTNMLASDNRRNLYFRVVGEERNKTLTVEGGGVNSTAVIGDIGATNGILHVIDRVLGMPYLTVYSKLAHDPDLHTTFKLSGQEEWNLKLNDKEKSYTFFVPNRKAWEDLKKEMPSEHKQLHLGQFSYHVHKILDRHLVVGMELTKEDLERQDKIQMVRGMFKISRQSGPLTVEWEGLQATIVRPDVKATNGIIHVIDRVMMKRRDLTKSGSACWDPSMFCLLFSVLFVLILAKL